MSITPSKSTDLVLRQAYEFSPSLVTLSDPYARPAESIRALRTYVMAQHLEAGRRALAICEASAQMGASFVAANLAVSLAQVGIKTLLIDGDLRNPAISRIIKPQHEPAGLRACLMDPSRSVQEFVEPEVLPNLSLLFSGAASPDAQELLAREAFEIAMNSCLRDHEFTIIDTPPANSCADARRISTVVGYSLIVARRHKGLVSDVKTLATQLRADHAEVIGTVLNA